MPKISLFEPKCQRKSENQCVLKSMKNVQNTTLENGFSRRKKSNPSLPSLYILVFAQIKAVVPLQDLEKTLQRCECEIGAFDLVRVGF